MPVIEANLTEILHCPNWAQVFADENLGNVSKDTQPVAPGVEVDCTSPSRTDIVQVIASVNGEHDEADWVGLFHLTDGRFLVARGGCDYTGWD